MSNLYPHEVLDDWFVKEVQPRMKGKTYLVRYGQRKGKESFTFLGFTHYWTKSRKGTWIVGRKTAKTRLSRALTAINTWCKANRHKPIREQWETLKAKLNGHYAYDGISLNFRSIAEYYDRVRILWRTLAQ